MATLQTLYSVLQAVFTPFLFLLHLLKLKLLVFEEVSSSPYQIFLTNTFLFLLPSRIKLDWEGEIYIFFHSVL